MFWLGCGPRTPDTALACSVAHDKHNIWVVGSSDAAMALAVNHLREIDGGWALTSGGEVSASVRYEVGGLMTARPHQELDDDHQEWSLIHWSRSSTGWPLWSIGPLYPLSRRLKNRLSFVVSGLPSARLLSLSLLLKMPI